MLSELAFFARHTFLTLFLQCVDPDAEPINVYNFVPLGELDRVGKDGSCGKINSAWALIC